MNTSDRITPGGIHLARGRTPVDALCDFCDRCGLVAVRPPSDDWDAVVRTRGPFRVEFGVRVYEVNRSCPVRFVYGRGGQGRYGVVIEPRVWRVRVAEW